MAGDLPLLHVWKPSSWAAVRRAIECIERMGGRGLPENCNPEPLSFEVDRELFPRAPKKMAPARSAGCELRARIALPYTKPNGNEGIVRACCVDDAVELWPRVARGLA